MNTVKLKSFFLNLKFVFVLYFLVVALISLLQYFQGGKVFDGITYTRYNNYIIFINSFKHLINFQNPYQLWLTEQWDLFKYSPTFALLMYPFTLLPNVIGLLIWNLLNAFLLFFAILKLKQLSEKNKAIILLFIFPELIISIQNSQSNGLMAGLLIMAFCLLESHKYKAATLLISLSVFIKIFGIIAFMLCLFYKDRWKSVVAAILFMTALLLLPSIFIGLAQLKTDYLFWFDMLKNDHDTSIGLSVLGFVKAWFNLDLSKSIVLFTGTFFLLLPMIKYELYQNFRFQILMLANILTWMVIFNHRAESPTFIIAIVGVALWYFYNEKSNLNLALLLFAFVFSSLSPTDLFPRFIRNNFIEPYALKVVPFIIIWIKIEFELLTMKPNKALSTTIS